MDNPLKDIISADPNIMGGKPIITGTRITVERIWEIYLSEPTIQAVLEAYPNLNEAQILAAIQYAKDNKNSNKLHSI